MPHILISNDDGIYAAGLRALVEAVKDLGTISIVAPSQERSGAAQSLTLRQPIFCEQVAEREWSIEGTPTDAMIVALHRLFPPPQRPDLVISGINGGANMGENIFYSGTVGAAMEAAINQVPALAVSVAHHGPDIDVRGGRAVHAAACGDRSVGRPAGGHAAQRQCAAGLEGRRALYAAVKESDAQRAAERAAIRGAEPTTG